MLPFFVFIFPSQDEGKQHSWLGWLQQAEGDENHGNRSASGSSSISLQSPNKILSNLEWLCERLISLKLQRMSSSFLSYIGMPRSKSMAVKKFFTSVLSSASSFSSISAMVIGGLVLSCFSILAAIFLVRMMECEASEFLTGLGSLGRVGCLRLLRWLYMTRKGASYSAYWCYDCYCSVLIILILQKNEWRRQSFIPHFTAIKPCASCSYNYSNITGMQQPRLLTWISDPTDRRVVAVRTLFLRALDEQSKNIINYYDFLLVAKKLNFRFEESAHLMELRKYFFNHKNQLLNKKLAALLCLEEQSLVEVQGQRLPEKIIIRFRVGEEIESIQEMTNQDEEAPEDDGQESLVPYTKTNRLKSQDKSADDDTQEYREKLTIILSIKVAEMIKKLKLLTQGLPCFQDKEETSSNIFTVFQSLSQDELPYEIFRRGVINLLKQMEPEFFREKLTMSEDDIRAVFSILDQGEGKISREKLKLLSNQPQIAKKITKFYEGRINKRMVKNTLFKLGKNSNSIQIYQVKNASVLQFRAIEDGLLEPVKLKERAKPRNPHFGPIKGSGLRQSPSRQTYSEHNQARHNNSSLSTYKREGEPNLQREREKIERIIRSSKEEKKRVGNDTIANKLRKLFIHKVILPRQKLLEEEKLKYLGSKSHSNQIIVKLA